MYPQIPIEIHLSAKRLLDNLKRAYPDIDNVDSS